jgi:hypothetical protein
MKPSSLDSFKLIYEEIVDKRIVYKKKKKKGY